MNERKKTNAIILILIGITLFTVALVFLVMSNDRGAPFQADDGEIWLEPMDLRQLHQSWLDEVAKQIKGIDSDSDPQQIRRAIDALLVVRVTAGDREEHLKIVMALLALERRDTGAWNQFQTALASLPNE